MPIDTTHPLYDERSVQWRRCRDTAGGSDAIKAEPTRYLARPKLQDDIDYRAYVDRALFYAAVERTVVGLKGLVLRKDPAIEAPDVFLRQMVDLTMDGATFGMVLSDALTEDLIVGRLGYLVTVPEKSNRPYLVPYATEQIVSWLKGRIIAEDGTVKIGPTRIVLRESNEVANEKDPYAIETETVYRELALVEGAYTVTLWRKKRQNGREEWVADEPIVPQRKGKPLREIPFITIGATRVDLDPVKPPVNDLAVVNIAHYKNSADLEEALHLAAVPTPYVTGYQPTDGELPVGARVVWTIGNKDAKVGTLEPPSQLDALFRALEHKEKLMAVLGARLLEGQARQNETAEAVRLRHAGDVATLTTVVDSLEEGLSEAIRWMVYWDGNDDAFAKRELVNVALNRDFFETAIDPQAAQVLMQKWQAGGISWETYFYLLQRGEWARPGATAEEEKALIDAEMAMTKPIDPADDDAE